MESSNPVFARRGAFARHPGAALYAPAARTMTIDDVVVRSFLTLATLTAAGALAWVFVPERLMGGIAILAVVVGLVFWAIVTFGRKVNPALVLGFAASYGVAVGLISHIYNDLYHGVVMQAVIGTGLAFGSMLTVYALRIVRVTPAFVRFVIAAGLALVGLMLLNLLVSIFHVGGIGIREHGPIGVLFSLVAIAVGCLYLLLDFRSIEDGVRSGAPEKMAWMAAFGLTLSLVWIYLELLRFLSYFTGRD